MPTTIPTTTSTSRPGSPSTGDAYFETDTKDYIIYNGSAWNLFHPGSSTVSYSANFDGTNDFLSAPTSLLNFYGGGGTISAWIKPSSVTATQTEPIKNRSIISKGGVYFSLGINEAGYPILYFYDTDVRELTGSTQVSTSSWMHIAATWDANDSFLYVNGTQEATSTNTPADISSGQTGSAAYVGKTIGAGADTYGGFMDELSLFNSRLTAGQITNIYKGETSGGSGGTNGTPGDLSTFSPLNWFRMGNGTGDTNSGGGAVTNGGTIGTVDDQGSAGDNLTGQNGTTYSTTVPA